MKRQIRQSVFETNSSAIHSLTIYEKNEWEDFKKGLSVLDDYDNLQNKSSYMEELRKSDGYKEWLEDYGEDTDELFDEFVGELYDGETINSYDTYTERYEVLEKEIPDSNYVAVSIYGAGW